MYPWWFAWFLLVCWFNNKLKMGRCWMESLNLPPILCYSSEHWGEPMSHTKGFLEPGTFSFKIKRVPDKLGWVGCLISMLCFNVQHSPQLKYGNHFQLEPNCLHVGSHRKALSLLTMLPPDHQGVQAAEAEWLPKELPTVMTASVQGARTVVPGTVLNALLALSHLIITRNFWDIITYFTDKETEAQRG